jgi:N-dimethylarginine dimethylaminohydrolase
MTILMCPPEYFGVEYEINPWMHVDVDVDRALARLQWQGLYDTYTELGEKIVLTPPVQGLPDMVFSANAAVVWNGRAVLSRFYHSERRGEEPYWDEALRKVGLEIHYVPHGVSFEGAGDALFVGSRMFCGYGFRTDRESHDVVAGILEVEAVSLELVDPHFYHLDTCFCPLDDTTVLFTPDAFSVPSQETIRQLVPRAIEVPFHIARGFVCNALPIQKCVVSSSAINELQAQLEQVGFSVRSLPMGEFMKSGGGVRCLSLPLEAGDKTSESV